MEVYLVGRTEDDEITGRQLYPVNKKESEILIHEKTINFGYFDKGFGVIAGYSSGANESYSEITPRYEIIDFTEFLNWFISVLKELYGNLDVIIYLS